jgi:hypothetical protein
VGASTLGQIVVTRDPVIAEAANNNTAQTAQAIKLPATLCGGIEANEDVDYFKFNVAAGTALTFHAYAHRLADRIHDLQSTADLILIVRDVMGTVVASSDNYFAADPLLHHTFAAGDYFLEVRDVRYEGHQHWIYCIEINDRPFVTQAQPLGVRPGAATKLKVTGFGLPADASAELNVPADAAEGITQFVVSLGKDAQGNELKSNPVAVVVSKLPELRENLSENDTIASAQAINIPSGLSGAMEAADDVDHYAFEAKKGERFTFDVTAQRQGSQLDAVLRVLGPKGERLIENDDHAERRSGQSRFNQTADARIEAWTAPADGRYFLQIRDVHQRGGPTFVMDLDTDKTNLAPGTAGVIHARITRKDGMTGEVQLAIDGLPKGVTAHCGRILDGGTDGCIILQAAADAPGGAANVRVSGTANVPGPDGKPRPLQVAARPLQEFYNPGGGRNHFPVQMHTVSVGEPLDLLSVRITPATIALKPGESKKIEVEVERQPDCKANLTLDVAYQHLSFVYNDSLPPGVSMDLKASQTLLTGGQTKGWITLKAAPDAKPAENQQTAVMVHQSINFAIKFTFASEPLRVTVLKP